MLTDERAVSGCVVAGSGCGCVLEVGRTIRGAGASSRGVCEAAGVLGTVVPGASVPEPGVLGVGVGRGVVGVVCGVSGSGKTTLLGDIGRAAAGAGWAVVRSGGERFGEVAAVDLVRRALAGGGRGSGAGGSGRGVLRAMGVLSGVGLGDLRAFACPSGSLSEGQRARLSLALALCGAERAAGGGGRVLLMVDEFCSALDGETARALSAMVGRRARLWRGFGGSLSVVVGTNRAGLAGDVAWGMGGGGGGCWEVCLGSLGGVERAGWVEAGGGLAFEVGAGGRRDYAALRGHHYRRGDPATVDRVLVSREVGSGALAGVLVTSMPTLNGGWRRLAWGDRFAGGDKRGRAGVLNAELRCISRVIVEPRYRGLGVARGLVRAYLASAATVCTEAVAGMGGVCPFFARAGMREFSVPMGARHARLLDCLEQLGVERWRLAQPALAAARVEAAGGRGLVERELRLWARSSGSTSRRAGDGYGDLFAYAACSLVGTGARAYAWGGGVGEGVGAGM